MFTTETVLLFYRDAPIRHCQLSDGR